MSNDLKNKITWSAPEYEFYAKDSLWHISSLLIALILVTISLWQQNILFAIFIAIAESIILFFGNDAPSDFSFSVDERRLSINNRTHSWDEFSSFAFFSSTDEDSPRSEFRFYRSGFFSLSLHIPAPANPADIAKIKNLLHNYLTEVEPEESLLDALVHFFRF